MSSKPFLIVDDFLDSELQSELWTEFQFTDLHPISRTLGAWKLSDGVPLGGNEIVTPPRNAELIHDPEKPHIFPSNGAMDHVITELLGNPAIAEMIGDEWEKICARPYVYPQGTGLSWHKDDSELYAGAFIYYVHPYWNAHWGGELLVAEDVDDSLDIMAYRFENEEYSQKILESGSGRYIMPKPNRLVLLAGAPHSVVPVSPSAGENVRASVSGFFLR